MQTTELQTKLENQKGFTLVEIAIVLVIIGLLLGGVLKGQELIENAKVKSIAKDMENMAAGYYSYQDRKGQYPDTSDDDAFWFQLKDEGFIAGDLGTSTDSDGPTHSYDGEYIMKNLTTAVANALDAKTYICANNIDGEVANNLDTKYDDGVHTSGTWRIIADLADESTAVATAGTLTNGEPSEGTSYALCREL
ncbi:prepilin-type N-terminal cleavage/methylation domain-containing protein [Thiomicrorhabdus sediminis]|uniref:Prepilin-type N-terminal cleavage/methylation domain-containing protein n=1 Tax=Thiomicrorhabdus sediminis TaxID=2580412 RepID=A0A4P9K8Y2_9GAMM|nr:prepilin-type N-terminal cleavage/methylation domain-containing protein [Thiomicrorhabdus sediminis]QCU90777.1 prepilin-type N-terminal cleavage/methylation domain-containing protein [Thiomicrorhabdus sediminis]